MTDAWQDISTAPKDGTPVLLGERTWSRSYEGCWMNWLLTSYGGGPPVTRREGWRLAVNGTLADPTHWMPLPEPPK